LKRYCFEPKQKNLNFNAMATLRKYSSFKSMKQNSIKVKQNANAPKKAEAEMLSFVNLIIKAKAEAKKA
jgi:hypothetical protein